MKKKLIFSTMVILLLVSTAVVYGQEKYALVIGNSNYTNFGTLRNPVNDANDIEAILIRLGFTVDKVLDGSLSQMEESAVKLKNRLTEAGNDSIGFFFYAGHGLELGGVNYLIPANAIIPDRNFLRERAFSVQIMLDMLNDSRNALNIVVLDACRDFPAAWSRSMSRGLSVVSNPPANHIIMYATGAGTVANDGTGRNGLFTSHLLNNLQQPGLDVNEIFRRTMGDVAEASNNEQRPALYTDFAKTMYFDTGIASGQPLPAQPQNPVNTPNNPIAGGRTVLPDGLYFTTDYKVQMGFFNFLLHGFGLGSFNMGDTIGGLLQIGITGLGVGLIVGGVLSSLFAGNEWYGSTSVPGIIVFVSSMVYGFVRPFSYDKKLAKQNGTYRASSNPMDNINIAIIPHNQGIQTVQMSYSISY